MSLVLLWSIDDAFSYEGLEIACPRGERSDGSVDCYWIIPWLNRSIVPTDASLGPEPSEPDLEEIQSLDNDQQREGS